MFRSEKLFVRALGLAVVLLGFLSSSAGAWDPAFASYDKGTYSRGGPYYHGFNGVGTYPYPIWGSYYGWSYPSFYPGYFPPPPPPESYPKHTSVLRPCPPPMSEAASIIVQVPADAKVWFDDSPTGATGASRTFQTRPLSPGKVYHYTVRASWTENGETVERSKKIDFQAGGQSRVDFTE